MKGEPDPFSTPEPLSLTTSYAHAQKGIALGHGKSSGEPESTSRRQSCAKGKSSGVENEPDHDHLSIVTRSTLHRQATNMPRGYRPRVNR